MIKIKSLAPTLFIILPVVLMVLQAAPIDESVPNTFGLITVTHARAGDNSQFMKYLDRYATMDCPIVTEMNIVWNNEQSMDEMGIYANRDKWKRNVNFYRTPNNSMNWRFKIAKQTTSQVFFSIDDDITVDCQELQKGFQVWRNNAIGSIGPIVSYGPRYYEYNLKMGFQYGKGKTKNVFNIGLVGLAFISRHFMDLYYTDLFQIKEMRDYVVQKNNCDDIGLNWVIQYFYPELKTINIEGNVLNISPKVAQATGKSHYPFRTQCIQKFTQIFGVNSLRYTPLNDGYPGKEKRMTPLRKEIVLAKKQYLQRFAIKKETGSMSEQTTKKFSDAIEKAGQNEVGNNQQNKADPAKSSENVEDAERLKANMDAIAGKLNREQSKRRECEDKLKQPVNQESNDENRTNQAIKLSEELRQSLHWRSYFQLLLVLVIIFLLWRLLQTSKQKAQRARPMRLQSTQIMQ